MLEVGKVYQQDCIAGMREMYTAGIRPKLTLTDIPYDCVNKQFEAKRFGRPMRNWNKGDADVLTFDLTEFLCLVEKLTTGSVVIFCSAEQLSTIKQYFVDREWNTRVIVWEKTNPAPINGEYNYLSGIELAVFAKRSGATFNAFCKNTVFRYPCSKNEIHPTQKSTDLWNEFVQDLTDTGDIVFDPCMGSFTTAVVCHCLQRRFIGFELNPEYYERGAERLRMVQSQISLFDLETG